MNILGLQFGHDGSACVVKDRKLVSFICTERINKKKKSRGLNAETLDYVLNKANLSIDDIDLVTINNWFWDTDRNGKELFDKKSAGFSITKQDGREYSLEDNKNFQDSMSTIDGVYDFNFYNYTKKCIIFDHHFSHNAYSFYTSPFENALSLSIDFLDGYGTNFSVYYFDSNNFVNPFLQISKGRGFSDGSYYGQICDFLGFYPSLTDAGKVMALAAYGEPCENWEDITWEKANQFSNIFGGDQFSQTLVGNGISNMPMIRAFYPQLKDEGGQVDPNWLNKNDWKDQLNKNIAATAQKVLETSIQQLVNKIYKSSGKLSDNLCLSGGTNLNCVSNGKLLHNSKFNIHLSPACGDDGLCAGSALFASNFFGEFTQDGLTTNIRKKKKHSALEVFEGGVSYSNEEISEELENYAGRVKFTKVSEEGELIDQTSEFIKNNKVVAWFYRGSEVGPRALGHRSILANASNPDMQDILNKKVKHREEFRPFAPVVPKEVSSEWFDLNGKISPYMLFSVKCLQPEKIPSAIHIDGTARVQTIDKNTNGRFYDLVVDFGKKTGTPVILNTSFNIQGQPIVEDPKDAIECFLGTKIDVLVLENFIVEKI
jgi:carbamoyltransferase